MLHRNRNNPTRVTEEHVGHSWSGWPDLSDPATRGCLLELVREAWGRPMLVAYYAPLSMGQGWYVADRFCGDRDYPVVEAPSGSEAEALVAALEAAQVRIRTLSAIPRTREEANGSHLPR
jgi:hypothetical protein